MARILIIYTGGTIGMIENPYSHALQPFDFDHLLDNVPKVKMLDFDIDHVAFTPPIDSSNMTPRHWAEIARHISDNYNDYDGFVVLHGTDTMAFTASALSFMLENLRKPVIITGSQLPIGEVRTDGEENLITALQIAAERVPGTSEPMVQEVAILFENHLLRGNRSTKVSAAGFNAFASNNYPDLARIGLTIDYNREALYRTPAARPLAVHYDMETAVMILSLHPGLTPDVLRHQLAIPGLKGVVMRTFGAGNSPTEPWFIELIREALERGLVIVNVTQCAAGAVNPDLYDTGNALARAGIINGHDITIEAALTKMMYLLGEGLSAADVKRYMTAPICGCITPRE